MKVKLIQQKPIFTVVIREGVELVGMVEESRWENFIKLTNVRGESLILVDQESPFLRVFSVAFAQEDADYTIISGSPLLLEKLKEGAPQ